MTAVLLAPAAVLVSATFADANTTLLSMATTMGILAALVQFLGLIRWPFAVPHLARELTDPEASASRKEAVDIVFQTLNRYLGVAVGEHLGYLFTGVWTALAGVAVLQSAVVHPAFGICGLILAPLLPRQLDRVHRVEREGRLEARGSAGSGRIRRMVVVAGCTRDPALDLGARPGSDSRCRSNPTGGSGRTSVAAPACRVSSPSPRPGF